MSMVSSRNASAIFIRTLSGAAMLFVAAEGEIARAQCPSTAAQTEGPYYRIPNPETNNLVRPGGGPLLTVSGQVLDNNCNPVPYTWLAFWHADANGAYDNTAPYDIYRGYFFTNANGEYTLYTNRPGLYPGRTRHIHVKVDGATTPLLTTQLYFPGEPGNATDGLYNPALEMDTFPQPDGSTLGVFDFHLPANQACTAPTVTTQPMSQSVSQGGAASFVIANTGTSPVTYQWRLDGVPLSNGAGVSGVTTVMLSISGVACSSEGTYDCVVFNSCGSATTNGATLTVNGCLPADGDNDGITDASDNCPLLANPLQEDADTDAIGDVCDNCPLVSNATQSDCNRDGQGDACDPDADDQDDDGDGWCNAMDNCPLDANPGQQDADADAVGDPCDNCPTVLNDNQVDGDSDGWGDACDNCILLFNPDQEDEPDYDGVGLECDNCPNASNPLQEDADRDGVGDACEPQACISTIECDDDDVCTCDRCVNSVCQSTETRYGNTTCDAVNIVNMDDILCALAGFGDSSLCPHGDIAPACSGNNLMTLDDILWTIAAFGGANPCGCSP